MVAATVRTIFAQPDPETTRAHLRTVADTLQPRFPKVAELLLAAETDVPDGRVYPGHGDDTTIGREQPALDDWEARGS